MTDVSEQHSSKHCLYQLHEGGDSSSQTPVYFIQAADCQLGMIEEYLEKKTDPKWDRDVALCQQAVDAINCMEPRPLFLAMCGDLVHTFPDGCKERRRAQIADFKRVFSGLDSRIPLVCVCGNHDIGSRPTAETVADYRKDFGEDYFYFVRAGVYFIVINSQYYENRSEVGEIAAEQDSWLEERLAEFRASGLKHGVVFQHIPWFLFTPDEPKEYFNLELATRRLWLDKFKEAGISHVFCGHYHRNAGGRDGSLEVVVTSAVGAQLGQDGHGLRLVRVDRDSIQHQYCTLDQLPTDLDQASWR